MKDMILFPEDIDRLNIVLSQLVVKADLLLAVLINKDGRLLTSQGGLDQVDIVSMAALVAGNSASTLAIAQLMGEHEFSTMYHQGKDKHIYIATVDENTFLSLVFDDRTNIDRVKVFARQFDRQIKAGLIQVYDKTEDQINLDLDMMNSFDSAPQQQSQYYQPPQPAQQSALKPPEYFDSRKDQQKNSVNPAYLPQDHGTQPVQQDRNIQVNVDEPVFDVDPNKNIGNVNPNDTNYMYLQNKIKETIKRKKED
jgi:predicted regulator of Ras-like GTPase activity (Roadblock/LC7/MglB family)